VKRFGFEVSFESWLRECVAARGCCKQQAGYRYCKRTATKAGNGARGISNTGTTILMCSSTHSIFIYLINYTNCTLSTRSMAYIKYDEKKQ